MQIKNNKLGRGLSALIKNNNNQTSEDKNSNNNSNLNSNELLENLENELILEIELSKIIPNPYQPRKVFDDDKIDELAESININGLLQPITVRKKNNLFEIVYGERRFRAYKKLKKEKIKAIIKTDIEDIKMLEYAIIENIQRSNLNPIEEANAIQLLIDKFNLTQEKVSTLVGKQRSTITNTLRLLKLPQIVKEGLSDEKITTSHAKILLSLEDENKQIFLYNLIVENDLSVKDTLNQLNSITKKINKKEKPKKNEFFKECEDILNSKLNRAIYIKERKNRNYIEIEFENSEDLEKLMYKLTNNQN
jgi:ParB family chromosome partitioning protein